MKETITLIGIVVTIFLGIYNISLAKDNRFISSINNERVKWINTIRDLFSQYDKTAFLQMTRFNELIHYNQTKIEDVSNELLYLTNHIELFLNPTEIVSEKLREIQDRITISMINIFPLHDFDSEELSKELHYLHYIQQVILKTEWKRVKKENKLGKEITDDVMNDLFMETAKKIDEDKYNLLLKDEFVKVQVNAFE